MTQTPSGKDDWATPQYLYDQLNEIFNFEVDAACETHNCKAQEGFFHNKNVDSLEKNWIKRTWCNPPFSEKDKFIKKAHDEVNRGGCPVCVMILPLNSISTECFHKYIENKYRYDVLEKRVAFLNNGVPVPGNNTGTVVVYFMRKPKVKTRGL